MGSDLRASESSLALTSRLALGTVQFGLAYGVANQSGQVALAEAAKIVEEARNRGLDTLDTAIAYGESELRLGRIGIAGWRGVSKLPERVSITRAAKDLEPLRPASASIRRSCDSTR